MTQHQDTADRLVDAARELFSRLGYEATSVRAITTLAGANLGAITYHFGSKEALYEAALASVITPLRPLAVEIASSSDPPLARIERMVRGLFRYLRERPEFPKLLAHHLASSRPLPEPAREIISKNLATMASLISEGQRNGSIRSGNPRDMALSIAAQPLWLTLARRAIQESASADQEPPETHEQIVASVVEFVRAGLRKHPEGQE